MVEDAKATTAEVKPPTEAELMAQLDEAMKSKDFGKVAKVSREIDKLQSAKEKAEMDTKKAALDAIIDAVKSAIMKTVKPIVDSGKLDAADGIWFSYDFGEAAPVLRLTKTATRAKATSTGGGVGKAFDISTDLLLEKYGTKEYKEGMPFQVAYESSTDKNWRYAIRKALLKLEGLV